MRAINDRPAFVRRYSISVTLRSSFRPGSYRGVILNPAATPRNDMPTRKSRRFKEFMVLNIRRFLPGLNGFRCRTEGLLKTMHLTIQVLYRHIVEREHVPIERLREIAAHEDRMFKLEELEHIKSCADCFSNW